jgi:type III secretion protein S
MDAGPILDYSIKSIVLVLMLSLPPIAVATLVGLLVSLVQALTQIQEQTLGFAVKLIATSIVVMATATWMGTEIFTFTVALFDEFPRLAK